MYASSVWLPLIFGVEIEIFQEDLVDTLVVGALGTVSI